MAYNIQNGWTASHLTPDMRLHDASLASRAVSASDIPPTPASSAIGPMNALAQLPLTAERLMVDPSQVHDPTLGSRAYLDPMTGFRQVAAQTSVYEQPNAPAFLQNAVNSLNAEQALRRSLQSELTNRILAGVQGGGPSAYLWDEALRAASVSPGAHVNFGAPIQNPLIGQGYNIAANAFANRADQQTQAISSANDVSFRIAGLQRQRDLLGANAFGQYTGSPQQKIDQQLFDLSQQSQPQSSVQSLGRAAAGGNGWLPAMPGY